MKEILKKCRQGFYLLKPLWRWTIIGCLGVLFLVLFFAVLIKYWLVLMPFNWRSKMALDKLAVSCYQEPVCHEDCFLEREVYRQVIIASWAKPRWQKAAIDKIVSDDENECLRLELAKLWSENYRQPDWPIELVDYLNTVNGDLIAKAKINQTLGFVSSELDGEISGFVSDNQNELIERYEALKLIAQNPKSEQVDFYFKLFKEDENLKIREQALIALSGVNNREKIIVSGLLPYLAEFINQPANNIYLKKVAVFLLSDYLTEPAAKSGLEKAWANEQATDKFTRAFLADILDVPESQKPLISSEEWQEYSQQSISASTFD